MIHDKVEALRGLKDGWLDGEGIAPNGEGLTWFLGKYLECYRGVEPELYPTPDGGIRAEWLIGDRDISLDVDLRHKDGTWHCWDRGTDEGVMGFIDLNGDWGRLNELIEVG